MVPEIRVRPRDAGAWSGRLLIDPRTRVGGGPSLALAPDGRVMAGARVQAAIVKVTYSFGGAGPARVVREPDGLP